MMWGFRVDLAFGFLGQGLSRSFLIFACVGGLLYSFPRSGVGGAFRACDLQASMVPASAQHVHGLEVLACG